jgi:hypothetical protein
LYPFPDIREWLGEEVDPGSGLELGWKKLQVFQALYESSTGLGVQEETGLAVIVEECEGKCDVIGFATTLRRDIGGIGTNTFTSVPLLTTLWKEDLYSVQTLEVHRF